MRWTSTADSSWSGLSSPPDRDTLVADLMVDQTQIAEVSPYDNGFQVEMYGNAAGGSWPVDVHALVEALGEAVERLKTRITDSATDEPSALDMHPPYAADHPIAWENYVAVQAVQAMLALLSRRVDAVSFEASDNEVLLFFAIPGVNADDLDDIEDICFELDVLLEGNVDIKTEVFDGPGDQSWPGRWQRGLYAAKGSRGR